MQWFKTNTDNIEELEGRNLTFKDWMTVEHRDGQGNLLDLHEGPDAITNVGLAEVASLIVSGTTVVSAYSWIAIGSGSAAGGAAGDTALEEEAARAQGTGSRVTTSQTDDTAQVEYTFKSGEPAGLNGTSTGSKAIEESGLYNEGAGGTLLARQTFASLNINWDGGDIDDGKLSSAPNPENKLESPDIII